jgi:hypothetical protein
MAEMLRGRSEIGDGELYRMVRELQAHFLTPPRLVADSRLTRDKRERTVAARARQQHD